MPKSKAQKDAAIEQLKTLDPQTRLEFLQQEKYSEKEIKEVLTAVAELLGEEPEAETQAPTLERNKAKGHPRFEKVQMYRTVQGGPITEGAVLKTVSMEQARADRLNSQINNTLIKYRPVK
jgi:hypothetical protein